MKAKYYLRGLGIGVIVAVVIMGVTQDGRKETLSDREIMERAAELGMVEAGGSLADMAEAATQEEKEEEALTAQMPGNEVEEKPSEESTEAPTEKPTETPEEMATEKPTETPTETPTEKPTETPKATAAETEAPTETPTEKPTATPKESAEETPSKASSGTVLIEVKSGEGSYTICQKLVEKGLITSATEFDNYLYTGGYDRKLRAGSFEIPEGAQPEEIAKILCGMR